MTDPVIGGVRYSANTANSIVYADDRSIEQLKSYFSIADVTLTTKVGLFIGQLYSGGKRLLKVMEQVPHHKAGAPATVRSGYEGWEKLKNKDQPTIGNNWDVVLGRQDVPARKNVPAGIEAAYLTLVNYHPGAGAFIQGSQKSSWFIGPRKFDATPDEFDARFARMQLETAMATSHLSGAERAAFIQAQRDRRLLSSEFRESTKVSTGYTAAAFGRPMRFASKDKYPGHPYAWKHPALPPDPVIQAELAEQMRRYTEEAFIASTKSSVFSTGQYTNHPASALAAPYTGGG